MGLDVFGLPPVKHSYRTVFFGNTTTGAGNTANWQQWNKPIGCSMLSIICIGGGAGGGGGRGSNAGSNFGGAGGGSSGISRYLYELGLFPDTLFVHVGRGGLGGDGGTAASGSGGAAGTTSRVALYPDYTNATGLLAYSSDVPAGGAGGNTVATAGGAGGVAATIADAPMANWAISAQFIVGSAGANSSASPALGTNIRILGGAGGGTAAGVGGGYAAAAPWPAIAGGPVGSPGVSGSIFGKYPLYYGGCGGGGGVGGGATNGGGGGNGYFGAGGGGGGGVTSTGTGGRGGDGGPGLVILTAW